MFNHPRRSINGQSLPTWLHSPGPVYMRKQVRRSKYEPLVEEVQLIQSNPEYSYVRLPDGRETTVSNRSLAPLPRMDDVGDDSSEDEEQVEIQPQVRKSTRIRRPPVHLQDFAS